MRCGVCFREAYGPVDRREAILDRPLATLYNLCVASRLPEFPGWAEASRERAMSGDLEQDLAEATLLARSMPVEPDAGVF